MNKTMVLNIAERLEKEYVTLTKEISDKDLRDMLTILYFKT